MNSQVPSAAARASFHLLLASACALAGCSDPLSPAGEFAAANKAVEAWIAAHPAEWSISALGSQTPQRPAWSEPCSASPPSGFVALDASAGATRLQLFFRCPVAAPATAAVLQAAFSHVVLERLPHGLAVPNWSFTVQTPSSSFSEGVTFSAPASGRLHIAIETQLYGIYGYSERASCLPPADGPSPEGCDLFREHRIPLALSLTVPWAGSGLQ